MPLRFAAKGTNKDALGRVDFRAIAIPGTSIPLSEPSSTQLAARYTPPWKRRGSTKVSSSSNGWSKRFCQSPPIRRSVSDRTREPIFGRCQSGRIKKRLLLAISLSRPYCERKSQPIQRSRTPHFSAAADMLSSATHSSRQVATYHIVSPIFGSAPR